MYALIGRTPAVLSSLESAVYVRIDRTDACSIKYGCTSKAIDGPPSCLISDLLFVVITSSYLRCKFETTEGH